MVKPEFLILFNKYLDFNIYIIKESVYSLFGKALKVNKKEIKYTLLAFINRKKTGAENNIKPFNAAFGNNIVNNYLRF